MNRKILSLIIIVCMASILCGKALAETIVFNSGKEIKGRIIERNDSSVKVDLDGITITYFLDEIKEIKDTAAGCLEPAPAREQAGFDSQGLSLQTAIIVRNISEYSHCSNESCMDEEYAKSINQEYDVYLPSILGKRGEEWNSVDQQSLNENGRYYDRITVQLEPSQETKTFYFDITDPFEAFLKKIKERRM